MNRRRFLGRVSGGMACGLAGCIRDNSVRNSAPSTNPGTTEPRPDVCERDPRPDYIPAIVDPVFASDYDAISATLNESTAVIGIERTGEARAYPIRATNEVVNDSFDIPVLVTYCPLCASGLTAIRRINSAETIFGNTGFTWTPPGQELPEEERVFGIGPGRNPGAVNPRHDPNLVMFDQLTGSYWSQFLAKAICGPLAGTRLSLIPSTATSWGDWKSQHPGTSVLLPSPHSKTIMD